MSVYIVEDTGAHVLDHEGNPIRYLQPGWAISGGVTKLTRQELLARPVFRQRMYANSLKVADAVERLDRATDRIQEARRRIRR